MADTEIDVSALLVGLRARMDDLKEEVAAVLDAHALAYPDAITLTALLTQVGNVVLASTGDDIRMQVTLDLDSQAGRG